MSGGDVVVSVKFENRRLVVLQINKEYKELCSFFINREPFHCEHSQMQVGSVHPTHASILL